MDQDLDDASLGSTSSGGGGGGGSSGGGSAMLLGTPHSGAKRRRRRALVEEVHGHGRGGSLLALKRQMLMTSNPLAVHSSAAAPAGSSSFFWAPSAGAAGPTRAPFTTMAAPSPSSAYMDLGMAVAGGPRPPAAAAAAAPVAAAAAPWLDQFQSMDLGGAAGGPVSAGSGWPTATTTTTTVLAIEPAAAGGGGGLVSITSEFAPGAGSGRVHVVPPPPPPSGLAEATVAEAVLKDGARVAQSLLRLWYGPAALGELGRDAVVRVTRSEGGGRQQQQQQQQQAASGGALRGLGGAIALSLLQLALPAARPGRPARLRLRQRVAVVGDVTLEGRFVSACPGSGATATTSSSSSSSSGHAAAQHAHEPDLLDAVAAALATGAVDCVVLPREDAAEARRRLGPRVPPGTLCFAEDLRALLLATAAATDDGSEAGDAILPAAMPCAPLYAAPTVLPLDGVSVAARCVEACALPRPRGGSTGEFAVTVVAGLGGSGSSTSSGGGGSSCAGGVVRAAINTARFLLLKHQADIARLLGPPLVDLRTMTMTAPTPAAAAYPAPAAADPASMDDEEQPQDDDGHESGGGGMRAAGAGAEAAVACVPVDIHVHLPQALPSPAYALPALLALVAVAWGGARESLEGIASCGEANGLGLLSLHERLRPTLVAALRDHGMRKLVLPAAPARELVRAEGGVGDRWLLRSGVVIEGVESFMDVVRGSFLGDDGL